MIGRRSFFGLLAGIVASISGLAWARPKEERNAAPVIQFFTEHNIAGWEDAGGDGLISTLPLKISVDSENVLCVPGDRVIVSLFDGSRCLGRVTKIVPRMRTGTVSWLDLTIHPA